MERFRHSWGSRRAAVSVVALYALFLQGFLAAALQASTFESVSGAVCAAPSPGKQSQNGAGHHHGLCCILACAACGCAYLASETNDFVASEQFASPLVWLTSPSPVSYQPFKTYLGARGPPQEF